MLFENKLSKPGLSIRLHGPKKNPLAFGSSVQIEYSDGSKGPKREIRSGAGYLSQDSPVQILGVKQDAKFIISTWPNGKTKRSEINGDEINLYIDK